MKHLLPLALLAGLPFLGACQSDTTASNSGSSKRVATRPASMMTAGSTETRISVPKLADAGVATDLRQALMALPQVTQVVPNLSTSEVVVRSSSEIPRAELSSVLMSLGLQAQIR